MTQFSITSAPHLSTAKEPWETLLSTVESRLARATQAAATMAAVAEDLRAFGKEGVDARLRACLADEQTIADIAGRSHFHANGFYKIVLQDSPAYRLRLHIWPAGTNAQENLHNHRWHFASCVLTGLLASEIWEDDVSPDGTGYDEYLYFGAGGGELPRDLAVGKARAVLTEQITHRAGDAYVLLSHVMHRIVSSGRDMTSTLACHTATAKRWARTISIRGDIPDSKQRFLTTEELKKLFLAYLKVT